MAPDLPEDERNGVGRECACALGVERANGFEQPDRTDLYQIFPVHPAPLESRGDVTDESPVRDEERLGRRLIPRAGALEQ